MKAGRRIVELVDGCNGHCSEEELEKMAAELPPPDGNALLCLSLCM